MNDSEIIRVSSALMQFGVACYALRLGKIFNTARVGWLVFSTLSLLAAIYILAPTSLLSGFIPLTNKVDIVYGLVSVVLILGMVYLDLGSKARRESEQVELASRAEWEAQVETKWRTLNQANEELRANASKLQAEIAAQLQARENAEKALEESSVSARKLEEELRQSIAKFEADAADQRAALQQASEQEGQARLELQQAYENQAAEAQSRLAEVQAQVEDAQARAAEAEQLHTALQQQHTALQAALQRHQAGVKQQQAELHQQLAASQDETKAAREELAAGQEQFAALRRAEEELRGTIARLQTETERQKQGQMETEKDRQKTLKQADKAQQKMLAAARQSGINEAATVMLARVDRLLQGLDTVGVSAQDLAEASLSQVSLIGKLVRGHSPKARVAQRRNPLDRQLRDRLAQLTQRLNGEKTQIARQVGMVKKMAGDLKDFTPATLKAFKLPLEAEGVELASAAVQTEAETPQFIQPVTEPQPVQVSETTTAAAEASVSFQSEETAPLILDEPVSFQTEEAAPLVIDESASLQGDAPAPLVFDESLSLPAEETAPLVIDEPASFQAEETAPLIIDDPVSLQARETVPLAIEEPFSTQAVEAAPEPIVEATPIQVDEPIPFEGETLTLEDYHEMTVSTVDLSDHLINSTTHTGTESSEDAPLDVPGETTLAPDQTAVRWDT